uniref:Thaumatin-like protein n=1 Tax=Leersia perrieri TaxID=77586 RepID=A0A0D9XF90_9ORYZ
MSSSSSSSSMAATMTFTISNYCPHPIWPGTLAGAGTPQLSTTGFRLEAGETVQLAAPAGWSGRIWARTGCVFDGDGAGLDCGGGAIACRSACEAFGQDKYCCSGAYNTPAACHPTAYSAIFKSACPRAYSYAYDDSTSTFTCKAYDYTIAFCLPTSGIKKSDAMFLGAQIIDGDGDGNAPPVYSSGAGHGGSNRPPIYYDGGGRGHEPETMTASSASTRYFQPWLLILLVFLF